MSKRFPSQRVPMYETSEYIPPQHYLEKILDGGAAMREREAELRARLTQGICQMCGKPVPEDRKIRRMLVPAMYCSRRCSRLVAWSNRGQMTIERAKELARVPAGFLLQLARSNRSKQTKARQCHRLSIIGRRGGQKTAQRGREYFSAIGKLGGKAQIGRTSWNAMAVPQ